MLGGGWTEVRPEPQFFAIAGLVEVEWDEANAKHAIEFTIDDDDGAPLSVPTPSGDQPVRIRSEFEVGRPPGVPRGTSFIVPIAVNVVPLPWTPGRRYVVKCILNGNEADRLRFSVRRAQQPQH